MRRWLPFSAALLFAVGVLAWWVTARPPHADPPPSLPPSPTSLPALTGAAHAPVDPASPSTSAPPMPSLVPPGIDFHSPAFQKASPSSPQHVDGPRFAIHIEPAPVAPGTPASDAFAQAARKFADASDEVYLLLVADRPIDEVRAAVAKRRTEVEQALRAQAPDAVPAVDRAFAELEKQATARARRR